MVTGTSKQMHKMKTLKDTKRILKKEFGAERVVLISTDKYDLTTNPKGRNSKKDRRDWADVVVKTLFKNVERDEIVKESRQLGTGEYNFSYIKFAVNSDGEVFGVVNGKSSFHCMYPSDVWFYDLESVQKKKVKEFFAENDLKWYTEKILVIKNRNVYDYKEAYDNEKRIKKCLYTFD